MITMILFLHPSSWNFYIIFMSFSTKLLHDSLLHLWYLYRFVQVESLSIKLYTTPFASWNFYKFYCFLTVSVYVNDCTTLFCIFHSEICISLSTKILQDSLLYPWYLYRFVESLSTKFYTTSFISSGIFINFITF